MSHSSTTDLDHFESTLLYLSREPKELALFIAWFLSPGALKEVLKGSRLKYPPKHPNLAEYIANKVAQNVRLRKLLGTYLLNQLSKDATPCPVKWVTKKHLVCIESDSLCALIRKKATSEKEQDWALIRKWIPWIDSYDPQAEVPEAEKLKEKAKQENVELKSAQKELKKIKRLNKNLENRLANAQQRLAKKADQLGLEHQRRAEIQENLDALKSELTEEKLHSSELKKRLTGASSASEREAELQDLLAQTQNKLNVLQQKFDHADMEKNDLRLCLEEHDHFNSLEEEEVPTFRNRPLLAREQDIQEALAARNGVGMPRLRILVVGGGEPQHRHQDKLMEYADELGFIAEWRMAEYQSWSKEISKLKRDMAQVFQGLVILHWNRTTFTQTARKICSSVDRIDVTCKYRGFTNLRESLQSLLEQMLKKEAASK